MIKGNSASGFGETINKFGRKVVTEFRQCSHCQSMWPYLPGSGHRVGMCSYCLGLLCTTCANTKWKQVSNKCVPFSEGMMENGKYKLDESLGIFLPK